MSEMSFEAAMGVVESRAASGYSESEATDTGSEQADEALADIPESQDAITPEAVETQPGEEQADTEDSPEGEQPQAGTPDSAGDLPEVLRGTPWKSVEDVVASAKYWQGQATPLKQEVESLRAQLSTLQGQQQTARTFDDLSEPERLAYEEKSWRMNGAFSAEQLFWRDQETAAHQFQAARQHSVQALTGWQQTHEFLGDEANLTATLQAAEPVKAAFAAIQYGLPPEQSAPVIAGLMEVFADRVKLQKHLAELPAMQEAWKRAGAQEAERRLRGARQAAAPVGKSNGVSPSPSKAAPKDPTSEFLGWLSKK